MQNHGLIYFMHRFPDDLTCLKHLEKRRWSDGNIVCPHCGHQGKIYRFKDGKTFKCSSCGKRFNAKTGTLYENSNIPLQKWYITNYLLASSKKGISSVELAKILNITQASSWYMLHRIRETLRRNQIDQQLFGIIEVDETYVNPGHRVEKKRGRGTSKVAVFGLVERKGNISITPVENAKRKTLDPIIRKKVSPGSHIMSDEWPAYNKLRDDYTHKVVKHKRKEYVCGQVHTNTIEGAWSHLKRNLLGTYHRPSVEHLDKYCAEATFCYNTRNDSPEAKFIKALDCSKNTRVRYTDIVN